MDQDWDWDPYHIERPERPGQGEEVGLGWHADGQEVITGQRAAKRARTAYDPKFNPIAMRLCRAGYTDAELAETFGVHVATLYRWKAEFPEFKEACQLGKEDVDNRVEQALYQRAVGYTQRIQKAFCHEGEVVYADLVEHVPGDTKAQSLWLRNRRRNEWRESTELTGAGGQPLIPSDPVQLREMARYYAYVIQRGALVTIPIEDNSNGT